MRSGCGQVGFVYRSGFALYHGNKSRFLEKFFGNDAAYFLDERARGHDVLCEDRRMGFRAGRDKPGRGRLGRHNPVNVRLRLAAVYNQFKHNDGLYKFRQAGRQRYFKYLCYGPCGVPVQRRHDRARLYRQHYVYRIPDADLYRHSFTYGISYKNADIHCHADPDSHLHIYPYTNIYRD